MTAFLLFINISSTAVGFNALVCACHDSFFCRGLVIFPFLVCPGTLALSNFHKFPGVSLLSSSLKHLSLSQFLAETCHCTCKTATVKQIVKSYIPFSWRRGKILASVRAQFCRFQCFSCNFSTLCTSTWHFSVFISLSSSSYLLN